MRKLISLVLVMLMTSGGFGYGKEGDKAETKTSKPEAVKRSGKKSPKKLLPIEVQAVGSENKPSQDYYYDGNRLKNNKQLAEVIDALGDPEASSLLKRSSGEASAGAIFNIGGGLLAIGGFIYAVSAQPTTVSFGQGTPYGGARLTNTIAPDMAPAWILGGLGAASELIGILFTGSAGEGRREAVKRYNHLVAPDKDLSMILSPYSGAPRLELTQLF